MKTKKFIQRLAISSLLLTVCFCYNPIFAQVAINTDGTPPDASSMLEVKSTDKGMLMPRLTQTEIEAIVSPADGLVVYNTDDKHFYFYDNGAGEWKEIAIGTGTITPVIYTIGSGGSCDNTVVYGTYEEDTPLDGSNTVNIDVNVINAGAWNITTNTVNGYSFSGSETFASTGIQTVPLNGSGTPIDVQTDSFTTTADAAGGNSTCTFEITVTPVPLACGDDIVDDRDSQTYTTLQIGAQCWMGENLNYETSNSWWYNNSSANGGVYGRLYLWDAALTACPVGWHLPTDAEWSTLTAHLGGENVAGGKLKETGTALWYPPNTGATNSSGFAGLPGGYYSCYGEFGLLRYRGFWWSATEYNSISVYARGLYYEYEQVGRTNMGKSHSLSVRCVRDD